MCVCVCIINLPIKLRCTIIKSFQITRIVSTVYHFLLPLCLPNVLFIGKQTSIAFSIVDTSMLPLILPMNRCHWKYFKYL